MSEFQSPRELKTQTAIKARVTRSYVLHTHGTFVSFGNANFCSLVKHRVTIFFGSRKNHSGKRIIWPPARVWN